MSAHKHKRRINAPEAIFIVLLAIVGDIISFIPGANVICNIIAQIVFTIFFFLNGVNMWWGASNGVKNLRVALASLGVEFVPFLSWVPMYTIQVLYTIHSSRKEDVINEPVNTGPSLGRYAAMALPGVGQLVTGTSVAKQAVQTKSLPQISLNTKAGVSTGSLKNTPPLPKTPPPIPKQTIPTVPKADSLPKEPRVVAFNKTKSDLKRIGELDRELAVERQEKLGLRSTGTFVEDKNDITGTRYKAGELYPNKNQ